MESLNVIALISGGKDSFFSILHCMANGHKVVALANLYPPTKSTGHGIDEPPDDLDSFMYQTVGHEVIPLYEQALGIPLYREEIRGEAINLSKEYAAIDDDETESLVPLLNKIKASHPEVNAVSTGAIFSTYQRTRVENVALRLGLKPLSFLWQYPFLPPYLQSSLLSDMRSVGQDARIIKVASGGLDDSFLMQNVADARTVERMKKAIGRFSENADGALLGEGGEFETLAIDGPSILWKKKIELEETNISRAAGTSIWHGKVVGLVEKADDGLTLDDVRKPPLFDEEFSRILHSDLSTSSAISRLPPYEPQTTRLPASTSSTKHDSFSINNLTAANPSSDLPHSAEDQLRVIFDNLTKRLEEKHTIKTTIAHCTLLLRNMSDFSLVNKSYAAFFNYTNPPSRVTISIGDAMPPNTHVILSVLAYPDPNRRGLHVQSQSYWAPANIGPYSQAISVPRFKAEDRGTHLEEALGYEVHVAGQIPLEPSSMKPWVDDGFLGEAVLALQHLTRIGRSQSVRWWVAGVAMIPWDDDRRAQEERIHVVQAVWEAYHSRPSEKGSDSDDDENVVDAWDLRNYGRAFVDGVERAPLPEFDAMASPGAVPPCFVVEVDGLPRDVGVEWSCVGLTSKNLSMERLELGNETRTFSYIEQEQVKEPCGSRYWTKEVGDDTALSAIASGGDIGWGVFYAGESVRGKGDDLSARDGVAWVPCRKVWARGGTEVSGVMVARGKA